MRFKARLTNPGFLAKILQFAIEKVSPTCVVHLSPTNIGFIVTPSFGDGVAVFSDLSASVMFSDYRVESKSNNEIMIELQVKNLIRAVKSGQTSGDMTMRLTRDRSTGLPYLTVDINNAIPSAHMTSVTHDVPIQVYTPAQMNAVQEPMLADPQVSIELPAMKDLQHVVERMKSIGPLVSVSATTRGELVLKVDTDLVYLSTFYKNLACPATNAAAGTEDDVIHASAILDIKQLARALHSWQLHPKRVICCIVESHPRAVVLCNVLDKANIVMYLPWATDD